MIACFFDYKKGKIPNKLIVFGVTVAVLLTPAGLNMPAAFVRSMCVVAVLYLLFMLGMLGAGDVKLCGMAVLYLDLRHSILFLAAGFMVAGAVSMGKMLLCRNLRERISYFFGYVTEIIRTGKIGLYLREELSMVEKKAVVHLAGPMLAGLVISWWFG